MCTERAVGPIRYVWALGGTGEKMQWANFTHWLDQGQSIDQVRFIFLQNYRDSPDCAVFWSPANRTIRKTALIEHWFSSKIAILVLNQSPISAVFQIVRFPGDQKTALTGESLYFSVPNRSPETLLLKLKNFFQIPQLHNIYFTPGPHLMRIHLVRYSTSAKYEKYSIIHLVRPIIHLVRIFALSTSWMN